MKLDMSDIFFGAFFVVMTLGAAVPMCIIAWKWALGACT